ncbi:helix-turn-helix domain-containing protein [Mariniphaga sediminis]|uniref:Helix-turn-helix domain-containing protein n=1 Tax=Mariniphaga sediminis TaxID=1628158 RepID=A0A399CZS6_9BACT|nr:helix-turn-helix domain-containing protein [Mariniphaga sediminis]RIH64438.1 helix-turn-helix domain-containing protein [Mariniphaga sediminis]
MIDKIYFVVTALASGGALVLGLCFLFLYIPESTFLNGYRIARKTAASAYLGLSLLYLVEIIFHNPDISYPLSKSIKLIVGSLQAVFFTYTFISLINTHFVSRKKILWEIAPISAFVVALLASHIWAANTAAFQISFYLFLGYYVSLLIRYLILFLKEYRACFNRADNYYSGEESLRLRWIYYSFFGMFTVGLMLLLLLILPENDFFYSVFFLSFVLLYSYFGIGFINYSYRYKIIEPLATTEKPNEISPENSNDKKKQAEMIGEALTRWVLQERFVQQGLTIEDLSTELNTNRTYLSAYINQVEQQSFRSWINRLKIRKAQKLLLNHPEMLVVEVAGLAGYSDSSNFNKQFVKITGSSAQVWRKRELSKKRSSAK